VTHGRLERSEAVERFEHSVMHCVIDEETQKSDLDIVREVLKVTKEVSIERAYDFSFAKKQTAS
jgi:hypothetical protein